MRNNRMKKSKKKKIIPVLSAVLKRRNRTKTEWKNSKTFILKKKYKKSFKKSNENESVQCYKVCIKKTTKSAKKQKT